MKNICFLIGNLNNSGGTERVTSLVANELSKRKGYKVSIVSLVDGLEPFFKLNDNISIYSLYEKKISFKKNFFGTIWSIRTFIKQYDIDTLIVVDTISCSFTIPALWWTDVNHICWEHFNFKNNNGVKYRETARKWAAKYCDYVVTLTSKDKKFWQEGLDTINAKLIHIANPATYQKKSPSACLDSKIVLAVGRLTKVKGFDLLLQTWQKICESNKTWTLYIVGGGPEEESLKQLACDLGIESQVVFTGMTTDVTPYYEKSSLFCLSSRNEGLPMVLLEAQSYGLPIVTFDCDTGPSDLVQHNVNGFLVEPEDITSMQFYLEKAMNLNDSEYQMMVKKSLDNVKNFGIQNIVNEWCDII
ncbi:MULTISPECIES: glycosyltransferase family 4 protein [Acinetobacter]|uniref:glycosyltransferase family 4 protein n=1 Tax=Acinetobacter TaxID=469 RepID=UPI0015D2D153|nr:MULTISPECIES: glycosyltransferase family 4 protein [Acinetobacter]MCP0912453.1 glycosyltransferase family 4 protein [Acinetobacter pseudolwoffii]